MPPLVSNGAVLQCSFGAAPGQLVVLPTKRVNGTNLPLACIADCIPMTNVLPFAMCSSPANPTVAAATAAALGILTPMPCVPVTAPWAPGVPTVMVGKVPAIDVNSKCQCAWGGVIGVVSPGQVRVGPK